MYFLILPETQRGLSMHSRSQHLHMLNHELDSVLKPDHWKPYTFHYALPYVPQELQYFCFTSSPINSLKLKILKIFLSLYKSIQSLKYHFNPPLNLTVIIQILITSFLGFYKNLPSIYPVLKIFFPL